MPLPVAYCGFMDTNNVGDYALFKANQSLFPGFDLQPGLNGGSPHADVNLFGGGTMYPHLLRYGFTKRRRVNVAIGLGVSDPAFDGRFGVGTRYAMWRWKFPVFGVRGPRSQAILAACGIKSRVTGDTALALAPAVQARTSDGIVAISLVGEQMRRTGNRDALGDHILEFCRWIHSTGRTIAWVPFCQSDVSWMECMRERLHGYGVESQEISFWSPPIDCNVTALLDRLAACDLMVGERLHACVLAAAAGVPFVGIGYKPKCFDFAESVGMTSSVVDPRNATSDDLVRVARDLLKSQTTSESLGERVSLYRNELHDVSVIVSDLLSRN